MRFRERAESMSGCGENESRETGEKTVKEGNWRGSLRSRIGEKT